THSIYDIEYLYECRNRLSPRQRQAIELFLYCNIRERDVARMMGVAETNPIAIYATQGLARLCDMIENAELPGYRDASARGGPWTAPIPECPRSWRPRPTRW